MFWFPLKPSWVLIFLRLLSWGSCCVLWLRLGSLASCVLLIVVPRLLRPCWSLSWLACPLELPSLLDLSFWVSSVLDFGGSSVLLLLLGLRLVTPGALLLRRPWHDYVGTWMPADNPDLASQVRSLQEQVSELTRLVQGLVISQGVSARSAEWEQVSASAASGYERQSQAESHTSSTTIFNQLAEQIPPIPDFCVHLCSLLSSGKLHPAQRAGRAWEAGHWARFCLDGKIPKVRPSRPCELANSVWVVLKCEKATCPLWCEKASDYRFLIDEFRSASVSHGFASKAEAKVYCLAAGFELPEEPYRWRP